MEKEARIDTACLWLEVDLELDLVEYSRTDPKRVGVLKNRPTLTMQFGGDKSSGRQVNPRPVVGHWAAKLAGKRISLSEPLQSSTP